MWRILVLSVIVFVSVKESNATYMDYLTWTAGSALNVTITPEDAVHCRLVNNKHGTVFDGFGPCRVVLDRVTKNHQGLWQQWFAVPGTVIVRSRYISVNVLAPVNSKPIVTSTIVSETASVMLKCTVPEEHEVQSCTFRDPGGDAFIASPTVSREGYYDNIRYESYSEDHGCILRLMSPASERTGIWRCAVNTTRDTAYNFFQVMTTDLVPGASGYYTRPELVSLYTGGSSTEGDSTVLSCSTNAVVRYCYYRTPNGTVLNVDPSTSSGDYEYVGNGFDAGECGIRINNVRLSDHGLWTCNVGLIDRGGSEELRDFINIYVNERMSIYHRWQGSSVVVRLRIATGPKLEYCRFVRGDGIGFTSKNLPSLYTFDSDELYGVCGLTIQFPVAEDLLPWTVIAKVIGGDGEVSMATTLELRPQSRGLSRTAAMLLWTLFGTILVVLIGSSLLTKKNREWTSQRVTRVRNSFRRQPQRQPNATELPQPNATELPPSYQHIDILTDLPPKV